MTRYLALVVVLGGACKKGDSISVLQATATVTDDTIKDWLDRLAAR